MRIIQIIRNWLTGLYTSGGKNLKILAIIGFVPCTVLIVLIFVLKSGYTLLKIFVEETVFYTFKWIKNIKEVSDLLTLVIRRLIYYLKWLYEFLINYRKLNQKKPELPRYTLLNILRKQLKVFYFLIVSVIILLVSSFWILTIINIFTWGIDWVFLKSGINLSILSDLRSIFNSMEFWSVSNLGVNIFSSEISWSIKIVGTVMIGAARYVRLKNQMKNFGLHEVFLSQGVRGKVNTVKVNWGILSIGLVIVLVLITFFVTPIMKDSRKSIVPIEDISTNGIPKRDSVSINVSSVNRGLDLNKKIRPQGEAWFDTKQFNECLNEAAVSLKALEYENALQIIMKASKFSNLTPEMYGLVKEVQTYIKAQEKMEALKTIEKLKKSIV
jgi:hypothetical protein